jgi:predicted amidohydrolase YtcJ
MQKMIAVLCWTLVISIFGWGQERDIAAILGYPQTILHNAKIITVSDDTTTSNIGDIVQAMAIRNGKILATGTDVDMLALAGPETRKIDLKERTVVPGIIGVHNHPQDWVHSSPHIMKKVLPDDIVVQRFLYGTPQEQMEKFPEVLREAVGVAKPGQWVKILFLWSIETSPDDPYLANWAGNRITKAMLDRIAPENPLLVRSRPMVLSQSNSAMLNQQGIEVVEREAPFHVFAQDLIAAAKAGRNIGGIPATRIIEREIMTPPENLKEGLRLDISWWAALGQTTFGGFLYHHPVIIKSYRELDKEGRLDARIAWGYGAMANHFWESTFEDPFLVADLATRERTGTDWMWYFGTGETAGRCVSMQPLPNRPTDVKLVMAGGGCDGEYEPGGPIWNALFKIVKEGGRVIGSHQFGDVDIDHILNLITAASREGGLTMEEIRSRRHTADHMQGWPRPDQIPTMASLGMTVGGSSLFIYQDSPRWMRDYGESSLKMVVPRQSMLKAGIRNGMEMDKPYEASPAAETVFDDMYWSISRKAQDGKIYMPDERVTREQALKVGTIFGAYYVLKEDVLGSLEPGKFADYLVLDRDYLTIPEEDIQNIRILMTSVGDKIVHLVPSLGRELGMDPLGAAVELGGPQAQY